MSKPKNLYCPDKCGLCEIITKESRINCEQNLRKAGMSGYCPILEKERRVK